MTDQATSAPVKGLDLGTSRIVLAQREGDAYRYEEHLNAFVALPYSRVTESMMQREGVLHKPAGNEILVYGSRAEEFANMLNGDTRRPMQTGLLNPSEPKSLEMIHLALSEICEHATAGAKICFSIPSAAAENESDLIYHQKTITQILEGFGYRVLCLNEGLAVVYAELESSNFTGIGISFGGGMCNVCLAYLGLPVRTFCTVRAGDYIDRSASSVTGETPTSIRLHKERSFSLNGLAMKSVDQALSVYYGDMIRSVARALEEELSDPGKLPKLDKPIPMVVSGGSATVGGFKPELEKTIRAASLPVDISEVRLAADPLNTTAKGALMAAILEP